MSARLIKELRSLRREASDEISLAPKSDSNIYEWRGWIRGPPDTPYEGGQFELSIDIPKRYPLQPPTVVFVTKVFHPNVHWRSGEICIDLLKTTWSAVYTLQAVCRSIAALLACPEASSPLNCDAGNLIRNGDMRGFNSLARMYTHLHASFHLAPLMSDDDSLASTSK
jgi:peroxin-4